MGALKYLSFKVLKYLSIYYGKEHFGRRVFISSNIIICLLDSGRANYYGSVKPTTICAFLGSLVVVYLKKCVLAAIRSVSYDAMKISHLLC